MDGVLATGLIIGAVILYPFVVAQILKRRLSKLKFVLGSSVAASLIMMALVILLMVLDSAPRPPAVSTLLKYGALFFALTFVGSILQLLFVLLVLEYKNKTTK